MTSVDFMFESEFGNCRPSACRTQLTLLDPSIAWKNRPDSLAGYFPRIHGIKPDGTTFYEMAGVYHKYSSASLPHETRSPTFPLTLVLSLARLIQSFSRRP